MGGGHQKQGAPLAVWRDGKFGPGCWRWRDGSLQRTKRQEQDGGTRRLLSSTSQDKGDLRVGLCWGGIWVGGTEDARDRAKTIAQRVFQLLQRFRHRVSQNLLV